MRLSTLAAAVLACLVGSAARAQTLNVPAQFPTIQAAVNAAPSGATIIVAPGNYVENISLSSRTLTIRSSHGAAATTLRSTGSGRTLAVGGGANLTLQGFAITPPGPGLVSGIFSHSSTLMVRDCEFLDCRPPSGAHGGAVEISGGSASFARCRFAGNTGTSYGGAIGVTAAGTLAVHSCTFQQNSSNIAGGAINLMPGVAVIANSLFEQNASGFGGAFATTAIGSQVLSSTFAGNIIGQGAGQAIVFGGSPTSNAATIANSIFWGNTGGTTGPLAGAGPGTTFAVSYSNVQGGYAGAGNINTDPIFLSDRSLSPNSPCIDAGSNAALPADTLDVDNDGNVTEPLPLDLAGNARRSDNPETPDTGQGATPITDIGAREFGLPNTCRPDFDNNGVVNSTDISAFLTAWLQAVTNGCN